MPEHQASTASVYYYSVIAAIGLLLIGGVAWYLSSRTAPVDTRAVEQQATDALFNTQTTHGTIPSTSNPVKDVTPTVNPVQAANPFEVGGSSGTAAPNPTPDGYHNPFQ